MPYHLLTFDNEKLHIDRFHSVLKLWDCRDIRDAVKSLWHSSDDIIECFYLRQNDQEEYHGAIGTLLEYPMECFPMNRMKRTKRIIVLIHKPFLMSCASLVMETCVIKILMAICYVRMMNIYLNS